MALQATLALTQHMNVSDILNLLYSPLLSNPMPNTTHDLLTIAINSANALADAHMSTNKLNHILGVVFTSLPLGLGGLNPFSFVPTCITSAFFHLYHDEVCLCTNMTILS